MNHGTQEGGRQLEKRSRQRRTAVRGEEIRRTKIHPGTNVGVGKDYTLFAKIDGKVTFERLDKYRKKVSVYSA